MFRLNAVCCKYRKLSDHVFALSLMHVLAPCVQLQLGLSKRRLRAAPFGCLRLRSAGMGSSLEG